MEVTIAIWILKWAYGMLVEAHFVQKKTILYLNKSPGLHCGRMNLESQFPFLRKSMFRSYFCQALGRSCLNWTQCEKKFCVCYWGLPTKYWKKEHLLFKFSRFLQLGWKQQCFLLPTGQLLRQLRIILENWVDQEKMPFFLDIWSPASSKWSQLLQSSQLWLGHKTASFAWQALAQLRPWPQDTDIGVPSTLQHIRSTASS